MGNQNICDQIALLDSGTSLIIFVTNQEIPVSVNLISVGKHNMYVKGMTKDCKTVIVPCKCVKHFKVIE